VEEKRVKHRREEQREGRTIEATPTRIQVEKRKMKRRGEACKRRKEVIIVMWR
jgi:hypothetical protein